MATAATIRINLIANAKGLLKGLSAGQSALHRFTNKIRTGQRSIQSFGKDLAYLATPFTFAAKTIISSVTAIISKLMQMIKWGTIAFAGISTALIKFAMDAQESENLFDVSMGNMAQSTREWSNELSKSLGLNSYEIRNNVGILKVMMESMGLTAEESTKMSKKLTELAYDLASFYNLKPDEAFDKLRAAISGEAEPMKRLGVLVNEATTKTWALNHQLVKEKEVLTEAQKVMARYGVIMDATNKAQGDLKRTGGSLTNVIRSIKSNMMEVGIEIGNSILPKINDLAKSFRDFIAENKSSIVAWGQMVYNYTGAVLAGIGDTFALLVMNWTETWGSIKNILMESLAVIAKLSLDAGYWIGENLGKAILSGLMKNISKLYDYSNPLGMLIKGVSGKGTGELVGANKYWNDYGKSGPGINELKANMNSTLSAGGSNINAATNPKIMEIWFKRFSDAQEKNNQILNKIAEQNKTVVGAM
jgi:hypothetical protein